MIHLHSGFTITNFVPENIVKHDENSISPTLSGVETCEGATEILTTDVHHLIHKQTTLQRITILEVSPEVELTRLGETKEE